MYLISQAPRDVRNGQLIFGAVQSLTRARNTPLDYGQLRMTEKNRNSCRGQDHRRTEERASERASDASRRWRGAGARGGMGSVAAGRAGSGCEISRAIGRSRGAVCRRGGGCRGRDRCRGRNGGRRGGGCNGRGWGGRTEGGRSFLSATEHTAALMAS